MRNNVGKMLSVVKMRENNCSKDRIEKGLMEILKGRLSVMVLDRVDFMKSPSSLWSCWGSFSTSTSYIECFLNIVRVKQVLERKDNTVLKLYKALHPFLMLEFGELRVSPVQKADMSNQSSELGTVTTVCREGQIKQYSKITIHLTRRLLRLLFRTTLKITQ